MDYNDDGFTDIFLCGERHAFLYRNLRGQEFKNVSERTRIDRPCEGGTMAKIDDGRRVDAAIVTKTRLKVLRQRADGRFEMSYKRIIDGGTEVAAGRLNGDRNADFYVVQRGRPDADEPDSMLINRRGGRSFHRIDIPQTRAGKGDYVTSLDYDRNGRADFVVMNGFHKHTGPVRLLAGRRDGGG